ncbi:hypothetical protein [Herbiconiux liukaitaii]
MRPEVLSWTRALGPVVGIAVVALCMLKGSAREMVLVWLAEI